MIGLLLLIPFDKSFASHEKAKYWSDNNELKPNEISKGSDKKCYFNCDERPEKYVPKNKTRKITKNYK
jgi:hypothetical protein